jgi:hypothetical protein
MRVNSYPRYTYKKGNIYYSGRVVPSDLAPMGHLITYTEIWGPLSSKAQ